MGNRRFWLVLLLCHFPCQGTGHIIDHKTPSSRFEIVVDFLSQLIVKDFRQHEDSFIIQYHGLTKESHGQLEDVVGEVLQRCNGVAWHLGQVLNAQWSYKVENLIIFVDSYESVSYLIDSGNLRSMFAFDVKCLIVLLPITEDQVDETLQQIFQLLHWVFVLKAAIAVPQVALEPKEVNFFTYIPYASHECGSTRPQLINTYRAGEQLKAFSSLYKRRRVNFNRCPLIVVVTPMPNFIRVDARTDGLESLSGIDGEHLRVFADRLNFTVQTIVVDMPGDVLDNGTATGIFEKLKNRDGNFSISGMSYFPYRVSLMSASQPYYQGSVFIALEVDTSMQPIDSTLRPYQWTVWLLLVALFALRFFMVRILKLNLKSCFPRTFRRFMSAMWLIAIFYYRTCYESVYFTFMQNPPAEPVPSTLQEMSVQGYTVIADLSSMGFFTYFVDYNKTVRRMPIEPVEAYDMVRSASRTAIATKEEHFASYMADRPERRNGFVIMPEVLFVDHFCVYFPRNSYLQRLFDDVIAQISAAGLTKNYIQKYIGSIDRYIKSSRSVRQQSGAEINSISLDHLKSVFIIYFIALAVAILVISLERASVRSPRLRLFIGAL